MNIHEYQAKEVLSKYGVPVPQGRIAFTPEEAQKMAQETMKQRYQQAVLQQRQDAMRKAIEQQYMQAIQKALAGQ